MELWSERLRTEAVTATADYYVTYRLKANSTFWIFKIHFENLRPLSQHSYNLLTTGTLFCWLDCKELGICIMYIGLFWGTSQVLKSKDVGEAFHFLAEAVGNARISRLVLLTSSGPRYC